jgi:hypothetical protein
VEDAIGAVVVPYRSVVCRHKADVVEFPDGTRVLASGWFERAAGDSPPHFGLYLDPMWQPDWPAAHVDWPDFGVPRNIVEADAQIIDAFEQARGGSNVEVACVGGHGRTGTVLACMAALAGVPAADAVAWVRRQYCPRAVQEPSQQYWMERFAARHGLP